MAARPEGDVNEVEFFVGADVKSRRRDFCTTRAVVLGTWKV